VATKNVLFCILIQRRKLKSVHGTTEGFADMVNVCSVCLSLLVIEYSLWAGHLSLCACYKQKFIIYELTAYDLDQISELCWGLQ